jgi:hypothetical protein
VGALYKHDCAYTYFTSSELHLGEISLECSRPGASAVALWATQKLLPLVRGGEFAAELEACREAAVSLAQRLAADSRWLVPFPPELDIVVWAPRAASARLASERTQRIFSAAAKRGLHLAVARMPVRFFPSLEKPQGQAAGPSLPNRRKALHATLKERARRKRSRLAKELPKLNRREERALADETLSGEVLFTTASSDQETVTCLRSVLMKPEHREWLNRILAILDAAFRDSEEG